MHTKEKQSLNVGQIISSFLLAAGIILTGILAVAIFHLVSGNADTLTGLVIIEGYLICFMILLFLILIYELKKTNQMFFVRHDVWGLLTCTVLSSIILPCSIASILSDEVRQYVGLDSQNIVYWIVILLAVTTVIWFLWHLHKSQGDPSIRQTLLITAQRMATFITLVGISQTEMPNKGLSFLFGFMGIIYTIMPDVIQRFHA